MKMGGNNKCNEYLQKHGIGPRTPIKQKYESPAAQLYKQVLKARVEGRPEPTELPPPTPARPPASGGFCGVQGGGGGGAGDPNGMERLAGETDQQYIARQTRLREEAKARMAAKFGNGGMGAVGSSRMAGIGSDPSYNPNSGYGGDLGVDSLISGFGSALSSVGQGVSGLMQDQSVQSLKSKGASFWGNFASTVGTVASSIAGPDEGDGLSDLQRQIASKKPTSSMYAGFGSDTYSGGGNTAGNAGSNSRASTPSTAGSGLQEAQGLPGEDRNGIERLSGESDEQYVMRQTRLREEARARMQAKFGGGGMSGVGSSSMTPPRNNPVSAPSSGNYAAAQPSFATNGGPAARSAPTSGNAPSSLRPKTPPKAAINNNDFFSSFGA